MTTGRQGFGVGVLYVLIANFGWSLSGLFVRLMPGLSGWQINCWRGFWMAVALLCYSVLRYGPETGKIFGSIPGWAMFWSALCFAAGTTFYVTSLTLVPTATVSVIGATSPLFAGLLSKAEKAFQEAVRWNPAEVDARKAIEEIRAERAVKA